MRIYKDKLDNCWYLQITKKTFIHSINEWKWLFQRCNWYTFHFINVYFERDISVPGYEFEIILFGLGLRLRANQEEAMELMDKWTKSIKEEDLS